MITEAVRRCFINRLPLSTSAGSIVMAIGIFSLFALHRLPFTTVFLERLLALELFIIWLYLALFYLKNNLNGILIQSREDQFGIGTWVAGSSVLAISCYIELLWISVSWMLLLIASVIWIIYLRLLYINLLEMLHNKFKVTGIILLSTVSTQSIVILLNIVLAQRIPILINQILISFGYVLYFIGIFIFLSYFISEKIKKSILNWSNTNSIIHGALSITGLAGLVTNSINFKLIIATWVAASTLFVCIEGISLIYLLNRIKSFGWSKGIFIYDTSQWSRIFTYGMYYAFTLSLFKEELFKNKIINFVVLYGQYIVFGILLLEIFLWLKSSVSIKFSNRKKY